MIFKSGQKAGPGKYVCIDCGKELEIEADDQILSKCPRCACEEYQYFKMSHLRPDHLIPIEPSEDINKIFGKEYGEYPFYGFFLYSSFDQYIIDFVSENAPFLQKASGDSVLLSVFENPKNWGLRWKQYWQEKLGPEFEEKFAQWSTILPEDRDFVYDLADVLGIDNNLIPCIIFVKSFQDNQILCVPIIRNKDDLQAYFVALFQITKEVKNIPVEYQFTAFQKKWNHIKRTWIYPEKLKDYLEKINKWGALIIETKNTLLNIFEPVTPFISPIKNILSK